MKENKRIMKITLINQIKRLIFKKMKQFFKKKILLDENAMVSLSSNGSENNEEQLLKPFKRSRPAMFTPMGP